MAKKTILAYERVTLFKTTNLRRSLAERLAADKGLTISELCRIGLASAFMILEGKTKDQVTTLHNQIVEQEEQEQMEMDIAVYARSSDEVREVLLRELKVDLAKSKKR